MFLGIDIGNTTTMIGLYSDDSVSPEKTLRYRTNKKGDVTDLVNCISMSLRNMGDYKAISADITGIAFSSVVPEINPLYNFTGKKLFNVDPFEIKYNSKFSIGINYRDIRKLGIDRIVNTVAAHHEYGDGCVVIDIGTAATFDVLNHGGTFDGGLISPGIGTTIKALAESASNLPEIVFGKPDQLVALDTENAIKSGFYYGWISLIEGVVRKIEKIIIVIIKLSLQGDLPRKLLQALNVK
jgi:type III pantothenate kinase